MTISDEQLDYFRVVLEKHWHDNDLRPMAYALLAEVQRLHEQVDSLRAERDDALRDLADCEAREGSDK